MCLSQQVVEKSLTNDKGYDPYQMCEIRLHDQVIATGRHPTSSNVAEQRACYSAYDILDHEAHSDDVDRPNPWLICTCKNSCGSN